MTYILSSKYTVLIRTYVGGSKSFRPNILQGLYSAIFGEVNVSVCVEIKGDSIEKQQSYFISVTLKSWSGQKLSEPPS